VSILSVGLISRYGPRTASAPTLTTDAYLSKPIDFDALFTLVEQYDSRSRQHGG
jgi:hypothetical protein